MIVIEWKNKFLHMENDVIRFLEQLRIPVSKKYVRQFVLSPPDYTSLLCLSDLLENLGLDFEIERVEITVLSCLCCIVCLICTLYLRVE